MTMQTAAMQYHTPIEYSFVTAPHPAEGPPDEGISIYYAKYPYYEWYLKSKSTAEFYAGLDESIELVLSTLISDGPFDGIMGFSQGAAMVTRLAYLQQCGDKRFEGLQLFKFAILIGGVPPQELKVSRTDVNSQWIVSNNSCQLTNLLFVGGKHKYYQFTHSRSC